MCRLSFREEVNRLVERKLVRLEVPFRRWAEDLGRSPNFQVQAHTLEVLLESESLRMAIGSIRFGNDAWRKTLISNTKL